MRDSVLIGLFWLLLLPRVARAQAQAQAEAQAQAQAAPPPVTRGRSLVMEARVGGGMDSNLSRNLTRSRESGELRLVVDGELEIAERLHVAFNGWFVEYLPRYGLNEAELRQLVSYRQPLLADRLTLTPGCRFDYQRRLTNFVAGQVLTDGAVLMSELGGRCSMGLEVRVGPVDLEAGGEGHVRSLDGYEAMDVLGASAYGSVRWVPRKWISLRTRYSYGLERLSHLRLYDLAGQRLSDPRSLILRAHQLELGIRARPFESLDVVLRSMLSLINDDFLGFLSERQVWGLAAVHFTHRVVTAQVEARTVLHNYPLRKPSLNNQVSELEVGALADAALWPSRWWGVFVRYEFDAEVADPFGAVYFRHVVAVGLAARTEVVW